MTAGPHLTSCVTPPPLSVENRWLEKTRSLTFLTRRDLFHYSEKQRDYQFIMTITIHSAAYEYHLSVVSFAPPCSSREEHGGSANRALIPSTLIGLVQLTAKRSPLYAALAFQCAFFFFFDSFIIRSKIAQINPR